MDEIGEVNPSQSIGTKNTHRRWGGREVLSKFELMKVRGGDPMLPVNGPYRFSVGRRWRDSRTLPLGGM